MTDIGFLTKIASICHDANRRYCKTIGDDSQPLWEDAPEWQRQSAIKGVQFHIDNPDAGPSASHEEWLREKVATGWTWGLEKDPEAKTHPCMVPYDQLPVDQRFKDYIFCALVKAFA